MFTKQRDILLLFWIFRLYILSMTRLEPPSQQLRPFIGIHFRCCRVYARIYLNVKGTAFVGWCPKCARKAELKVSPEGASTRFFEAD